MYLRVYDNPLFIDFSGAWTSFQKAKKKTVALNIYLKHTPSKGDWLLSRPMSQRVDLRVLKSWVARCKNKHTLNDSKTCDLFASSAGSLPTGFKVFDVNTRSVINAPWRPRFIALSYVWGSPNTGSFRLSKKHVEKAGSKDEVKLPDTLTQVIEDAIRLVRDLGEKYLWIDALCIIHDDSTHLSSQINAMDAIYGCAFATIIAASGFSFTNHLPGYSDIERSVHLVEGIIGNRNLIVRLPTQYGVIDGISRSPWKYRAWTYQEGLLSLRRIIFTNQEVFFACCTDMWAESCEDPPEGNTRLEPMTGYGSEKEEHGWIGHLFNNRAILGDWQFKFYAQLVREYLSRDLTFASDSLHAFKGLERRIHTSTGARFFWGLPEGEFFLRSLLWLLPDPQVTSPQRHGFPSWAWVGWFKGPNYMHDPGALEEPGVEEPAFVGDIGVKFWKETEDGKLEMIDTTSRFRDFFRQPRAPIHDFKNWMYVESVKARFEVRQVSGSIDSHLFFEGEDYGPVKFTRISRRDVHRGLVNRLWDFLAISRTVPQLADRDVRHLEYHRLVKKAVEDTTGKDEPLLRGSQLLGDKKQASLCNTMVLEWQGDMAKCIALCEIKQTIWLLAQPKPARIKLG